MEDKYLPLGTVVALYDKPLPLVITGYKCTSLDSNKKYDYSACIYPFGVAGSKGTVVFNHNEIAKILHEGYKTENSIKYNNILINETSNFKVEDFYIETIHRENTTNGNEQI